MTSRLDALANHFGQRPAIGWDVVWRGGIDRRLLPLHLDAPTRHYQQSDGDRSAQVLIEIDLAVALHAAVFMWSLITIIVYHSLQPIPAASSAVAVHTSLLARPRLQSEEAPV